MFENRNRKGQGNSCGSSGVNTKKAGDKTRNSLIANSFARLA
jgi:hypothetical protein